MKAKIDWIKPFLLPEGGIVTGYGKVDARLGRKFNLMDTTKEDRVKILKMVWKEHMGTDLDLEHPKSFNEKMQWTKIYFDSPERLRCEDKVLFKNYILQKLGSGYTTKPLRLWTKPEEVSFDDLPDRFVVKSNAQGNGYYVEIIKSKKERDLDALRDEIREYWFNPLNLYINGFIETNRKMSPKVFVEEYIEEFDGQVNDYKFWCFNGTPKFLNTTTNHFENFDGYPIGYYDLNWNLLDLAYQGHEVYKNAPKPKHFTEMIELARKLSAGFPFVRVDFFDTPKQLYLAELTFEPNGGFGKYNKPEFDIRVGELITLPSEPLAFEI